MFLSGIHNFHIREGLLPPPTVTMHRLAQVLKGIKISQVESQQQLSRAHYWPITPEILRRIKYHWKQHPPSQDRIMLWATFLTCFFHFFRLHEICSGHAESFDPSTELSVENVRVDSIHNSRVTHIWLAKSKMDQIREVKQPFIFPERKMICAWWQCYLCS